MYYFDGQYLRQFLGTASSVKVYVGGEYLTLVDTADVEHPQIGVGYTEKGEPVRFNYKEVEQVKAGETIFTKEMLQHEIEKIKNPDAFKDEPEEEDGNEEKEESGDSVDNTYSVSGGGGGDDFGGDEDFEGGEAGDFEGDEEFEIDDTEGGDEEIEVADDAETADVEPPEDEGPVEDGIIRTGDFILNENFSEGTPGRYGRAIFVDGKVIQYTYYSPNAGKEVTEFVHEENVKRTDGRRA